MAKYYQDFVGLNTFVYEANGWNVTEQTGTLIGFPVGGFGGTENPSWPVGGISYGHPQMVVQNRLGWVHWNYAGGIHSNAEAMPLSPIDTYRNYGRGSGRKYFLSASFKRNTFREVQLAATASFV